MRRTNRSTLLRDFFVEAVFKDAVAWFECAVTRFTAVTIRTVPVATEGWRKNLG